MVHAMIGFLVKLRAASETARSDIVPTAPVLDAHAGPRGLCPRIVFLHSCFVLVLFCPSLNPLPCLTMGRAPKSGSEAAKAGVGGQQPPISLRYFIT